MHALHIQCYNVQCFPSRELTTGIKSSSEQETHQVTYSIQGNIIATLDKHNNVKTNVVACFAMLLIVLWMYVSMLIYVFVFICSRYDVLYFYVLHDMFV